MKQCYLYFLLCGFALTQSILSGQGLDVAHSIRYGGSARITNLEPAENGPRQTSAWSYFYGIELRGGKKTGWLLGIMEETITSRKSPATSGGTPGPFNMIHPYHSSLSASYLMLGAQYNFRIGQGDLSIGGQLGPGLARYSRTWDVLTAKVVNDKIDPERLSFASDVDRSRSTWRLAASASVRYTYWFSRRMAFSLGAEYSQSNYLGGGVDTGNGLRYELSEREFLPGEVINRTTPLFYNINYDRRTLAPNPGNVIRQLRFTIGITGKFNTL